MWACRVLKPAPYVLQGLFEVFEMHLVHTYATFADVPLAALLGEAPMPEQVRPGQLACGLCVQPPCRRLSAEQDLAHHEQCSGSCMSCCTASAVESGLKRPGTGLPCLLSLLKQAELTEHAPPCLQPDLLAHLG